jgi:hypothetical protein
MPHPRPLSRVERGAPSPATSSVGVVTSPAQGSMTFLSVVFQLRGASPPTPLQGGEGGAITGDKQRWGCNISSVSVT